MPSTSVHSLRLSAKAGKPTGSFRLSVKNPPPVPPDSDKLAPLFAKHLGKGWYQLTLMMRERPNKRCLRIRPKRRAA